MQQIPVVVPMEQILPAELVLPIEQALPVEEKEVTVLVTGYGVSRLGDIPNREVAKRTLYADI
jgi:hypothetical protein